MKRLLKIFSAIPVSTKTADRSFYAPKGLQYYSRNTVGQERLSVIALLRTFRDSTVSPEEILKRMTERRRMSNISKNQQECSQPFWDTC